MFGAFGEMISQGKVTSTPASGPVPAPRNATLRTSHSTLSLQLLKRVRGAKCELSLVRKRHGESDIESWDSGNIVGG